MMREGMIVLHVGPSMRRDNDHQTERPALVTRVHSDTCVDLLRMDRDGNYTLPAYGQRLVGLDGERYGFLGDER